MDPTGPEIILLFFVLELPSQIFFFSQTQLSERIMYTVNIFKVEYGIQVRNMEWKVKGLTMILS